MSAYKDINCLILNQNIMLWVLKRTVAMRRFFRHKKKYRLNPMCKKLLRFYAKNCFYLDYDNRQYTDMIHLSAQVELAELATLQVIVKSN